MATEEQDVTLTERLPERLYTLREVQELVHLGAGVGSGAVMRQAPDVVMPSEEIIEGCQNVLDDYHQRNPSPFDMCETAWGIIANAWGGNWDEASPEWREAAERWRDTYHALLDRSLDHGTVITDVHGNGPEVISAPEHNRRLADLAES